MIDTSKLFTIGIEAGLIIAGFVGIAASIRVFMAGKKISTAGMLFLALGILIDALTTYAQTSGLNHFMPEIENQTILMVKSLCFVAGAVLLMLS